MGAERADAALHPADRLDRAAAAARSAGLSALLLTPGADLRYVCGYHAHDTERLTCLVVPAEGTGRPPVLVVPKLEERAAHGSPAGQLGLDIVSWDEHADPYALVHRHLDGQDGQVGLADHMWAMMVLQFRDVMPGTHFALASRALRGLREVKTPAEVAELRAAGAAIDRVQARVPALLVPGRTELDVAAGLSEAIVEEGHAEVAFVIVGSGPNAASPHHGASGRVLQPGDAVVIDIGGHMASGYTSDCTRTYAIGEPPAEMAAYYQVLRMAQDAACAAVRPGVTAGEIDAAAREPIEQAGYGEFFVHRTGHGIGLEVHEHPYIIGGNTQPLRPGHAFSVEPGIYPGPHGARIEDIVVCTEDGAERLNNVTRELVVVG